MAALASKHSLLTFVWFWASPYVICNDYYVIPNV